MLPDGDAKNNNKDKGAEGVLCWVILAGSPHPMEEGLVSCAGACRAGSWPPSGALETDLYDLIALYRKDKSGAFKLVSCAGACRTEGRCQFDQRPRKATTKKTKKREKKRKGVAGKLRANWTAYLFTDLHRHSVCLPQVFKRIMLCKTSHD